MNYLCLGFVQRTVIRTVLLAAVLVGMPAASAAAPAGYVVKTIDPEVVGKHKYGNFSVHREHSATRHWQHPTNPGEPFTDTVVGEKDSAIHGHKDRVIVHAVPFRTSNGLIDRDKRDQFDGLYDFISELTYAQKIPLTPMFYRPTSTNYIYHARVTQQRWERIDHKVVDFLIVSYNSDEKIRFIDEAATTGSLVLNDHLPAPGLYLLQSIDNDAASSVTPGTTWTGRREKWKQLQSDAVSPEQYIEIRVPRGVLSIPGVGLFSLTEKKISLANDEIGQLKAQKLAADREIDQMFSAAGSTGGTVIITGPTGCGKSTFINCYADNPCVSRKRINGTGWELYFSTPLPNFAVGHEGNSQTDKPAFYPDTTNNIVLCDTAGDEDTRGRLQKIINAGMTHRMFHNPSGVKLLLVIDEAKVNTAHYQGFIQALEDVVNSCPQDSTLQAMIHLMISKHRDLETDIFLKSLVGDPTAVPPVAQNDQLNGKPRLVSLIKFLIMHPERLSTFAEAPRGAAGQRELPFTPDLTSAKASLHAGPLVMNPDMNIKLSDDCNNLIEGFARRLNEDMVNFLRTEGAQRLIEFCRKATADHNSKVADLRGLLTSLVSRLRAIDVTATPEKFVEAFEGSPATVGRAAVSQLFDVSEMRSIVENLRFLKTILPHNVVFKVREWKEALSSASAFSNTIGKIETLAKKPKVTVTGDSLLVNGVLVGSSDVESVISEINLSPAHIVIHALNTFFIDKNMIHPCSSVYAIAPHWKVTAGAKVIDLSGGAGSTGAAGLAGANGTATVIATAGGDGQPGNPGTTAGSFFGKFSSSSNLPSLTIKAHGGQGGDGGAGGKGGAGKGALDGQEAAMVITQQTGDVEIIPWGYHHREQKQGVYFEHRMYFNVAERYHYIGYLAPWIGPKFGDQVWVHGRVKKMEHAPLGGVGKDGGKGGQKGLGGHAGDIVILGPDAPQKECTSGVVGSNDGSAGDGGAGGKNGNVLRGTRWTDCWIRGEASPNPKDRWHPNEEPTHSAPAVASAAAGGKPTTVSSTVPISPTPKVAIDQSLQDAKVGDYRTFYREQAKNPLISPFIRSFPGLGQ